MKIKGQIRRRFRAIRMLRDGKVLKRVLLSLGGLGLASI